MGKSEGFGRDHADRTVNGDRTDRAFWRDGGSRTERERATSSGPVNFDGQRSSSTVWITGRTRQAYATGLFRPDVRITYKQTR